MGVLLTGKGLRGKWESVGEGAPRLTEVLQHTVTLQLGVSDLVLQQNQLLLVLVLERLQPPLAVLQLIDQLLLDLDLTCQVGQVRLEVHLCRVGAEPGSDQQQGKGQVGTTHQSREWVFLVSHDQRQVNPKWAECCQIW